MKLAQAIINATSEGFSVRFRDGAAKNTIEITLGDGNKYCAQVIDVEIAKLSKISIENQFAFNIQMCEKDLMDAREKKG